MEWNDWPFLEKFLEPAQNRTRLISHFTPATKHNPGRHGAPPADRGPGKAVTPKNTAAFKGIPHNWIKTNGLCLLWNMGRCSDFPTDHLLPDTSTFVKHICAGCLAKKLGEVRAHCLDNCTNGPFPLFR